MSVNLLEYSLPGYYFVKTRLPSLSRKVSFVFIYIVPTIYIYASNLSFDNITFHEFFNYFLSVVALYTVYEIGYIGNDTISQDVEVNSTRRLEEDKESYLVHNKKKIYLVRLFYL